MASKVKTIGVLTSGGDAPGHTATAKYPRRFFSSQIEFTFVKVRK